MGLRTHLEYVVESGSTLYGWRIVGAVAGEKLNFEVHATRAPSGENPRRQSTHVADFDDVESAVEAIRREAQLRFPTARPLKDTLPRGTEDAEAKKRVKAKLARWG